MGGGKGSCRLLARIASLPSLNLISNVSVTNVLSFNMKTENILNLVQMIFLYFFCFLIAFISQILELLRVLQKYTLFDISLLKLHPMASQPDELIASCDVFKVKLCFKRVMHIFLNTERCKKKNYSFQKFISPNLLIKR